MRYPQVDSSRSMSARCKGFGRWPIGPASGEAFALRAAGPLVLPSVHKWRATGAQRGGCRRMMRLQTWAVAGVCAVRARQPTRRPHGTNRERRGRHRGVRPHRAHPRRAHRDDHLYERRHRHARAGAAVWRGRRPAHVPPHRRPLQRHGHRRRASRPPHRRALEDAASTRDRYFRVPSILGVGEA